MPSDIIVVQRDLLKSEVFRKLNGTAKTVYFDFLMKCKVKSRAAASGRKKERVILNNGQIQYSYSEAEKKGILSGSFMRAIDTLIEHGFIDISHSGNGGKKGDMNLYSISDRFEKWGTDIFVLATRPKDTRSGRGFQPGNTHGRNTWDFPPREEA